MPSSSRDVPMQCDTTSKSKFESAAAADFDLAAPSPAGCSRARLTVLFARHSTTFIRLICVHMNTLSAMYHVNVPANHLKFCDRS